MNTYDRLTRIFISVTVLLASIGFTSFISTAKAFDGEDVAAYGVDLGDLFDSIRDRSSHHGRDRDGDWHGRRGVHLGEEKVDKFIVREYRFRTHRSTFGRAVILSTRKADVDIRDIVIVYSDGYAESLDVSGTLREDIPVRLRIYPGRVQAVIVHAISPNLFGSRGRLNVYLGGGRFFGGLQ